MALALELASKAQGTTSPNPPVGAVVVKDGRIVGKGYTLPPGQGHAEAVALKEAGEHARGGVLYTSLEPCHIYGRVPPCTKAIITAGIAEVHIAIRDPNPRIDTKGLEELRNAGIKVLTGEHEEEADALYEPFTKFITTGMPFVIAKFAMSLDGKIATRTGDSRWITGEQARAHAHELRRICDAVLVGVNTVKKDDPLLTARDPCGQPLPKQPLRVVVDSKGTVSTSARLFRQPGKSLVAVSQTEPDKIEKLRKLDAEVLVLPSVRGRVALRPLLEELGKRDIVSLLVEGGGTLLASFFSELQVDKVVAFIAPVIVGGRTAPTPVEGTGVNVIGEALRLTRVSVQQVGKDIMVTGYPKKGE